MPAKRKSAAERRQAREQAELHAYDGFMQHLKEVTSFVEANSWVGRSPDSSPARKFYANLGFFLQTFAPPDGASTAELSEYLRLLGCFDKEGALKPGVRAGLEEALKIAGGKRR